VRKVAPVSPRENENPLYTRFVRACCGKTNRKEGTLLARKSPFYTDKASNNPGKRKRTKTGEISELSNDSTPDRTPEGTATSKKPPISNSIGWGRKQASKQ